MHKCNNSKCFNPDHLQLGTYKENNDYCVESNRPNHTNKKGSRRHKLRNPCDREGLLALVKVNIWISPKNEWLWLGYTGGTYPRIRINNKIYSLHKLILANKLNKKYEDIKIARHCLPDKSKPHKHDLNPDHLFEGTRSDNAHDTTPYHKGYVLTEESVKLIKKELKNTSICKGGDAKKFDSDMAAKLNVSVSVIRGVRLGKTYKRYQDGAVVRGISDGSNIIGKPIVQLDLNKKIISKFASGSKAAKILNFDKSSIYRACNNEIPRYKNFIWMFEKDYSEFPPEDQIYDTSLEPEEAFKLIISAGMVQK